jgi:hypothetical protein
MFTDFILRNLRGKKLNTTLKEQRASLEELRAGSNNPLRGHGDSKGKDTVDIVIKIIQNKCSRVKHRGVRDVSCCIRAYRVF